jgi:DNA-directed RNA polymerase specialized sigma24 family protein
VISGEAASMAGAANAVVTADDVALVERSLAGHKDGMQRLVERLLPVIQARVGGALVRRRGQARGRSLRQESEDLVQEVFAALLERQGRVLRMWRPERGLSLKSFVALVAERQVGMILRTGRRNPFTEDPTESDALERHHEQAGGAAAGSIELPFEARLESRDFLRAVLERLRERLSPQGYFLFELLVVQDCPIEEATELTGLSREALYTWRSRIGRLAREIQQSMVDAGPAEQEPPVRKGPT